MLGITITIQQQTIVSSECCIQQSKISLAQTAGGGGDSISYAWCYKHHSRRQYSRASGEYSTTPPLLRYTSEYSTLRCLAAANIAHRSTGEYSTRDSEERRGVQESIGEYRRVQETPRRQYSSREE